MRALAPGRSGWPSAIWRVSSSHSCVSHLDIVDSLSSDAGTPAAYPRRGRPPLPRAPDAGRAGRGPGERPSSSGGDSVPHPGEEVVLVPLRPPCPALATGEVPGQGVVLEGMDAASHLPGKAEPPARVGVHLSAVGKKGVHP